MYLAYKMRHTRGWVVGFGQRGYGYHAADIGLGIAAWRQIAGAKVHVLREEMRRAAPR